MKRSYLIAGGAGFLGSHISENLINKGHEVTVIDNLLTGCKSNIEHLLDHENFSLVEEDIIQMTDMSFSPNVIINLAAIANPLDYEENPLMSLSVNSEGNLNLLKLALKNDSSYVFFSSSEIYGNHNPHPECGLKEIHKSNLLLGHKRSPYFIGKMYGEELVKNYCISREMNYLIVRPFNIYGPKMDRNTNYGRVIPNFIRRGLKGEPLLVNGAGNQERSFCHIDDFTECIYRFIKEKMWVHRVVNIGNPQPISVLDLAKKINSITNNSSGFKFQERFVHEPDYRKPNIDRVKGWLDWSPSIPLEKGIKKTIRDDEIFQGLKNE